MVELRRRRKGHKSESVILPFKWTEENWGDAYARVRNIFVHLKKGHSLRAAADLAACKAPKKPKDWSKILESFKDQKINFGTAIIEATFKF